MAGEWQVPKRELIDKLTQKNNQIRSGANSDPVFLKSILAVKLRNFPPDTVIELESPITAIVGRNGTGKSTLLYLAGCAFAPPTTDDQVRTRGKTFNEFIPDSQQDIMMVGSSYGFRYGDNARQTYVWHERTAGNPSRIGNREWDRRPRSAVRKLRNTVFLGFEKTIPNPLMLSSYFRLTKEQVTERLGAIGRASADLESLDDRVVSKISWIAGKQYSVIERRVDEFSRLGFDALGYVVDGKYSDLASGSGEIGIIRMVDSIMSAPGHSLIVIDEPESGVHQNAQEKLLEFFIEAALDKNHQILYTTHSEYMLDGLAPASILLLEKNPENNSIYPQHANKAIALKEVGQKIDAKFVAVVEDEFARALLNQILESEPALRQLIEVQTAVADGWQHMVNTEFPKLFCAFKSMHYSPIPILILDGDVEQNIKIVELDNRFGSLSKIKSYERIHGIDRLVSEITKLCGRCGTIRFKSIFKPHLPRQDKESLLEWIADYVHHFYTRLIFFPGGEPPDVVISEWLQIQLNNTDSGIQRIISALLSLDKRTAFERRFGVALPDRSNYNSRIDVAKQRIDALQSFQPSMRDQVLSAWVNEQSEILAPIVAKLVEVVDA